MRAPVVPAPRRDGSRRRSGFLLTALLPIGVLALPACTPDLPAPAQGSAAQAAPDARMRAHEELAHRLRRFPLERSGPGVPRAAMAADDERFRLGAFWRARADTHHFNDDFRARAAGVLTAPGSTPAADAALRRLLDTVEARLPAWQTLVDYNAAGTLREDGGEEGRRLLPWAIAAIDAIEVATWDYLDTVEAAHRGANRPATHPLNRRDASRRSGRPTRQ